MSESSSAYAPIESYALLSDCHSSALVGATGSIDWACLRRFDSGAAFCRLLDAENGGAFELAAVGLRSTRRSYLPDTNVLETVFETDTGTARLLDCFTMRAGGRRHPHQQLLRIVEGIAGRVSFHVGIEPRFDYGRLPPWLRHHSAHDVFTAVGGDDALVISAGCLLHIDAKAVRLEGDCEVGPGERCRFSLVASMAHEVAAHRVGDEELDERLERTIAWWRDWVARGEWPEAYRDACVRSALVLKALTCAPTGAVIAAPTTSLPEAVGGPRNWDYRYSWVRDSTLTLSALYSVGHRETANGFKLFVERTTAGRASDIQIMYGCYGERRLPELELSHLPGYRESRPVRIGNAAASQVQLDVYGELLDAWHLWTKLGNPLSHDEWRFLRGLVEAASEHWEEPDRGLWEMRGPPRHFVHSKVMCWMALDRGIEIAQRHDISCDVERWQATRDRIREAIDSHGVDPERGCFVQAFGSTEVDAALLLLPIVGYVHANDPRMEATVTQIEKDLSADHFLLRRYRPEKGGDGLRGGEGFFLASSFWLVEVLAMQGRLEEARERFESLLGLANDLGLLAEEYDPEVGQLGNFPQAFTHVAVLGAAAQIADAEAHGKWEQSTAGHRAAVREQRKRRDLER